MYNFRCFCKNSFKNQTEQKYCGNIKRVTQAIFPFFCQNGDLDFGINSYFGLHLLRIPKLGFSQLSQNVHDLVTLLQYIGHIKLLNSIQITIFWIIHHFPICYHNLESCHKLKPQNFT